MLVTNNMESTSTDKLSVKLQYDLTTQDLQTAT